MGCNQFHGLERSGPLEAPQEGSSHHAGTMSEATR